MKVAKLFTNIRNNLSEREDKILFDIDEHFNNQFFKEEIIQQSEKLPNELKLSLEIGNNINNYLNKNSKNLNEIINDCIFIENNVNNMKIIEKNINKSNSIKIKIKFIPEKEEEINKFIQDIKNFGKIIDESEEINEIQSFIINQNDFKIIKDWINPNKNIRAELLYRLSKKKKKISTFHELCDNKGPTLTLFHSEDGNKGGIYTPLSWDTKSREKSDSETFMFNLNRNEKYIKKHKRTSIWCLDYFGPWTISIGFIGSMKTIEHNGLKINDSYENGCEILPNKQGDHKYFSMKEVEVYKLIQ